jgi:DNA-binding NtrC family response regulator
MKIRILIIDDEPRWIDFVKQDLDIFEIVVAQSEKEALERLKENMFALVIASSRHLKVLETISEKYSDKTVVVTTIKPSVEEAIEAYRLGAVRYFPKSFSQKDLLKQVKDIIPGKD